MDKGKNFIEQIIDEDLSSGFDKSKLQFRFPPEPNGFLHIGHVKAIVLNFELAKKYGAKINLRFEYSYLVIAKPTMLNNEYTIIKETLFKDLERIR